MRTPPTMPARRMVWLMRFSYRVLPSPACAAWGNSFGGDLEMALAFARLEMEGPAPERGEPGAEDHAVIDQVGCLDDGLFERTLALDDERIDELASELLEVALTPGLIATIRLAVLPGVEPGARLLPEPAALHEEGQARTLGGEA